MERKIGETFEYEGKTLKVKENENGSCHDCFFDKRCTLPVIKMAGECAAACREDNKGVVFVEIQGQTQKTKEPKERKIGETFEFEGHKLKVVDKDGYGCDGCFFLNRECSLIRDVSGFCSDEYRTDKKRVIFIEHNDEQPKLNLCEVLKDCPKGWGFWSPMLGNVKLHHVRQEAKRVSVILKSGATWDINADGTITVGGDTSPEVMLFPNKWQKDWSKFPAPWYKKERFDPKTLKAFDRVIVYGKNEGWFCTIFSHIWEGEYPYNTASGNYAWCIPYNDDTKHLVGTTDDAPDFYKYWED